MARSVSDEELQLKKRARRRLIGAIVLVTTVAVVLPMVLDREPRQVSQDINIKIPSPESGAFAPNVAPLPPPPESKPVAKAPAPPEPKPVAEPKPAPAVKEAAEPPAKMEVANTPAKAAETKDAAKKISAVPKEEPAKKAAPLATGPFVVQVVALSDAVKAKQMQQQITSAGIKAYTEIVKTAKGDVTRVRVGPFASRNAAEKAQQQLKAIGLDGKVIPK
jgi:DedD protein